MALQASTKFRERILGAESFADIFDGGRILLYTDAQPPSADHAAMSPHVAQITVNGGVWSPGGGGVGLSFEQFGVWVSKDTAQTWKLKASASGLITWFRLQGPDDDPQALSYVHPRIDGAVSDTAGSELLLVNASVTIGDIRDIHQFLYTLLPVPGA